MKKRILIVGNLGGMGRRYTSILKYLGHDVEGVDAGYTASQYETRAVLCDGIIIASPTCTHLDELRQALNFNKPILCEKPITVDLDALLKADDELTLDHKDLITMVNQYNYFDNDETAGHTRYDYYNSGGDGIGYDCVNLIGLARGSIVLKNESPLWFGCLNGGIMEKDDMDYAYITMIDSWCQRALSQASNWDYIMKAHRKVAEWHKFL